MWWPGNSHAGMASGHLRNFGVFADLVMLHIGHSLKIHSTVSQYS
jgi:hypothetical protein